MKNMASSEGEDDFELFSEQARQTFLIFLTVSVSAKNNTSQVNHLHCSNKLLIK